MKDKMFDKRQSAAREPATLQADFNKYIRDYNEDFLHFLRRAASGSYSGLVSVGKTLKDFHELIVFVQSATTMRFELVPLPFTLRQGRNYYRALGFKEEEITNIEGFFNYVEKNFHQDFEDWMSQKIELPDSE